MKRIILTATTIILSLVLASPAAAKTISFTDPRGDANAVDSNEPSGEVPDPPYSYGPIDITKASIGTVYKKVGGRKVATAVKGTLTLAEPLGDVGSFWYILGGSVSQPAIPVPTDPTQLVYGDCARFEFNYNQYWTGTGLGRVRVCDPDGAAGPTTSYLKATSKVSGNTITWTVALKDLNGRGIMTGAALSGIYARVYFFSGAEPPADRGLGFPLVDDATTTQTYSIGK